MSELASSGHSVCHRSARARDEHDARARFLSVWRARARTTQTNVYNRICCASAHVRQEKTGGLKNAQTSTHTHRYTRAVETAMRLRLAFTDGTCARAYQRGRGRERVVVALFHIVLFVCEATPCDVRALAAPRPNPNPWMAALHKRDHCVGFVMTLMLTARRVHADGGHTALLCVCVCVSRTREEWLDVRGFISFFLLLVYMTMSWVCFKNFRCKTILFE